MARNTSVAAYQAVLASGYIGKKQQEVYDVLFNHGPLTSNEIFQHLVGNTMQNNANINARCSELRDMEVVQDIGTKVCSVSGMTVQLWDVTPNLPVKTKKLSNSQRVAYAKKFLTNITWRVKNNVPIELTWLQEEQERLINILEKGLEK